MSIVKLQILIPYILLAGAIVLLLLIISFNRNHILSVIITSIAFILSFISLREVFPVKTTLFIIDGYTIFFTGLSLIIALAVTLLSYGYLRSKKTNIPEYYILLILATLGAAILIASCHFISLFLGLEILSIALYVLIAFFRDSAKNIEAGIKYFILAAASSALMLFGMSLFYAETGSMNFIKISEQFAASSNSPFLFTAFCLILIGIGFKLAVVPFHLWTPDVYEGAPAPVTAYIATVSKGAAFAVLFRFYKALEIYGYDSLLMLFYVLAICSMFIGNILALRQNNIKRILAYSSIAHIGYLLIALISGGGPAGEAISLYLTVYFITTIIAFGIITFINTDVDALDEYTGLFWERPVLGSFFFLSLISLAGIPLTAGFIGKFYIAITGVFSKQWLLLAALIINSIIGIYYYLRVIVVLFEKQAGKSVQKSHQSFAISGWAILFIFTFLIIYIGVYPQTLIALIKNIIEY